MNEAAFDLIDGIPHYKLFIDGQWVRSSRNQLADDINPATGKVFARTQQAGAEEVIGVFATKLLPCGPCQTFNETILKPFWSRRENGVKRCAAMVHFASAEVEYWRSPMTALVQALSRLSGTETETDAFTIVVLFCGVGLLVSLTLATYGLDLSPGFF